MIKPEVLAPAGNPESLDYALRYGADAVYLAGRRFGMRSGAANFDDKQLADAVSKTHAAAAKLYVACNVVARGSELEEIAEHLRLLERLLRTGIAPEYALRLLNSCEILRGAACFSTVDLLQVDLGTGEAAVYKWGAAPSYFREGEEVRKIGTATTPPGAGVGGEHAPERYELSLKRGEMLVLVSDGAGGPETEAAIAAFRGDSPQELAALLIAGMPAEDDMTAVAFSLRPCTSR